MYAPCLPTGLEVSESCVHRTLHRAGYSVQRPVLSVSSPDPEYEPKAACLQELQRQARAGEIELYYEDEVDLVLLPGVMRCWGQVGHQRKIDTPRQNKKQYGAGLIHRASCTGPPAIIIFSRSSFSLCYMWRKDRPFDRGVVTASTSLACRLSVL